MRKILLALAATALLVASPFAVAGAANADVDFDSSTGIAHVSKGNVQSALHLNNAGFDAAVTRGLRFTAGVSSVDDQTRWLCTDGSTQSRTIRRSNNKVVTNAPPVLSASGKQITGWDLSLDTQRVTTYVSGALNDGDCPEGASFVEYLQDVFTNFVNDDGLKVNGVNLTNAPVPVLVP